MKTIKELKNNRKEYDPHMWRISSESTQLSVLQDIIKLIDDIFRSSNFNKEIAKELKQRIEG